MLKYCMQVGGAMDRAKPGRLDVLQPSTFNNYVKCLFAELNSHYINYHYEKDFKGSRKLQKIINNIFSNNYKSKNGTEYGAAFNKKVIK